jgi:hypothetical protein
MLPSRVRLLNKMQTYKTRWLVHADHMNKRV